MHDDHGSPVPSRWLLGSTKDASLEFSSLSMLPLQRLVLTVVKVLELPDSLEAAQAAQGPRPLSSPGSWVSTNTSEQTLSLSPKGGLFVGRLNVSPPPPAPTCSCFPHGPPMGATYFLTRGQTCGGPSNQAAGIISVMSCHFQVTSSKIKMFDVKLEQNYLS